MQNDFFARLLKDPSPPAEMAIAPTPKAEPIAVAKTSSDVLTLDEWQARLKLGFNQYGENSEIHDSALFDVVVEVDFYDGRRIRIPQTSTPAGWEAPF